MQKAYSQIQSYSRKQTVLTSTALCIVIAMFCGTASAQEADTVRRHIN